MSTFSDAVIRQLTDARNKRFMSQETLGQLTKLGQSGICRIETGARKKVRLAEVEAICEALGLSVTEVVLKAWEESRGEK